MMRLVFFCCLFNLSAVFADTLSKLPDPFSMQQAMEMANDMQHYQILEAQSAMASTLSQLELAESKMGFRAQLELEAAYIEPSRIALDQSQNDGSATLRLIKPLYDFAGSDEKVLAANIEYAALNDYMQYIILQRKLDISRQFLEVILTDLKYTWDNEAMAIAFVRFDADKDRYALSQISDVDMLESENRYMDILHQRSLSEMNQRHSRAVLAELLNRPTQLPSNLNRPEFDNSKLKLPEYSLLLDKVMLNNPMIKLSEKRLEAANQRMIAAGQQLHPRLDAEIQVSEYARLQGSNDEWRAQLSLVVPLYENASIKSDVAKARAGWLKQRAELLNIKMQIRKQLLQLWQSIDVLSKRREQLQTSLAFRELNLDKSRALYEMEVKTDLGNSMVAISEVQYKQAKNEFELALAWMQLRILAGETDINRASL